MRTAERRVKRAFLHRVPSAAYHIIKPGMEVLVYREKEKRWMGSLLATAVDEKLLL